MCQPPGGLRGCGSRVGGRSKWVEGGERYPDRGLGGEYGKGRRLEDWGGVYKWVKRMGEKGEAGG